MSYFMCVMMHVMDDIVFTATDVAFKTLPFLNAKYMTSK